MIREAKRAYLSNISDAKHFWSTMHSVRNASCSIPTLESSDVRVMSDVDKAELFFQLVLIHLYRSFGII